MTGIPSDGAFVGAISTYVRECAKGVRKAAHMYVETAGGKKVHPE